MQYNYKGYGSDKVLATPAAKPAPKPASKPAAPQGDGKAIVPYPGKPLYAGAKGMVKKDIERIQRAVGASVTGKYDKQTEAKVTAYQKRKKLDADGVVGKDTWNMLF
ncbi:peptidoglycan-binding protein [Exiguobacterium sp. PHA03]|uniref:peptidoglycan-binding domain-containing protein n=1 Tax=Exiguobacterium sp. PHA03 TaxID=3064895 RepID=UPI0035C25900